MNWQDAFRIKSEAQTLGLRVSLWTDSKNWRVTFWGAEREICSDAADAYDRLRWERERQKQRRPAVLRNG